MKITCAIAMLCIPLSVIAGADGNLSQATRQSPTNRQQIIAAHANARGDTLAVLTEVRDSVTRYRMVLLDTHGKVLHDNVLERNDKQTFNYKLVPWKAGYALGWTEPGKGLQVAVCGDGHVHTEMVLPDDPDGGGLGEFWILGEAGQQRLLLERFRYEDEGGTKQVGRQYRWLYCYDLKDDTPKLLGRACIESDDVRAGAMACGSDGHSICVWQVSSAKTLPVQTIRVAEWADNGRLRWRERFTGNEPLGLRVDPDNGNVCCVLEWKSPEDGSGVVLAIRKDSTSITPLGAYVKVARQSSTRFLFDPIRESWLLAQRVPDGIECRRWNADLTTVVAETVVSRGVVDYALLMSNGKAYVLLLCDGSLVLRRLGDDVGASGSGGS